MGIGYTIDTAIKVAHLGIDSVLSLVDDGLIEKMRAYHSEKFGINFKPIPVKKSDYRALRISAYLNLINLIVKSKFSKLKAERLSDNGQLKYYIDLLPESHEIKSLYASFLKLEGSEKEIAEQIIKEKLSTGSIDVNIMSKGDTVRYRNRNERLPDEFNDAHAAIRGFLKSDLKNSSLIISAGLNPKLFTYLSKFSEILPNKEGQFDKKICIKVSDYRSALIQGKFLAQRGVWTSEFRIESGLNCGGHAFATKGILIGPILEEFKNLRGDLVNEMWTLYKKAMTEKGIDLSTFNPQVSISAQGGIGTYQEAEFMRKKYELSSVGWGSPFLLVPEVVNVDEDTLKLLIDADETDIYLSNTSPFGIPFYTVIGNTKDEEKIFRIKRNVPGSICPKRFVALNTEFGEPALCAASKDYQKLKIESIKEKKLSPEHEKHEIANVTAKTCICVGLGTAALLVNKLEHRIEGNTVSICPGPNLAYFDKKVSLKQMVDHIYGKSTIITTTRRPHVFLKELLLYKDYLKDQIQSPFVPLDAKQKSYFMQFRDNLILGIEYYHNLIDTMKNESKQGLLIIENELKQIKNTLLNMPQLKLEIVK